MPATALDPVRSNGQVSRHPLGSAASRDAPARVPSRWCFLLGLGGMTFIRLIGYLAFTEVYFLATAVWRFGRYLPLITTGAAGMFSLLWVGWTLAAVSSDLWNNVLFELLARGVSRAVLTGIATLSIFIICYPSMKRLEWILVGLPFSMIISLFYFRPGQSEFYASTAEDMLKFDTSLNYIITAATIAAAACLYERFPWPVIAGLFALGPTYVLLGSRSSGGVMLLAGLTTLGFRLLQTRRSRRLQVGFGRLLIMGLVAVAGVAAMKYGYEYAAENRLLSEKDLRKYDREQQTSSGIFMSSRGVYIVTGLLAWQDKPFLGHGSWPEDAAGYYSRAAELVGRPVKETRLIVRGQRVRTLLPVHSQLFGALVEHGILAFAFFAYMTWLVLWSITFVPSLLPRYTALFAVLYWMNLWNFVASPQTHRIPTAAAWAFFLLAYAYRAAKKQQLIGSRRIRNAALEHRSTDAHEPFRRVA
jgi:hypothetical protein